MVSVPGAQRADEPGDSMNNDHEKGEKVRLTDGKKAAGTRTGSLDTRVDRTGKPLVAHHVTPPAVRGAPSPKP